MVYSNMLWNNAMEIPLMIKHVQIINHFGKKYNVVINRDMTFAESKFISESITKIKFLKVRKIIDDDKLYALFKLVSSTEVESKRLGYDLLQYFLSKTRV